MRNYPGQLLAFAALLCSSALFAAETKAPNVIVIMADELGYGDVGFSGTTSIPTPNLNRIAAGGVICTRAYVSHVVNSANRAGLLTGRYPSRFGYERSVAWRPQNPSAGLPVSEKTLAEALRPLGYRNGLVGKWHLGAHDNFHPLNRGFDEFFGYLGGGHRSFPEELNIQFTHEARIEPESYRTWLLRGMQPVRSERYLTDALTLEALEFVRNRGEKPFFLFLSYNAPRSPLQAPEADVAAFAHIKEEKRRTYAAMIAVMDRGIGQLLDLLDSHDLAENTLVFFLSSSGGDTAATGAYNGVGRGMRGEPFEGGIRVPFVVRWPAKIPAGQTYREPVSTLDVFATVAAATRILTDAARPLDGVDLVPFLRGEKASQPHQLLFQRSSDHGMFVVSDGMFKLIQRKRDMPVMLYNLADDTAERNNLAEQNPDIVKSLTASFQEWSAQMIEPTVPGLDMKDWSRGY
jgi:arylsulfatase A-like enzyme